MKELTTMHGIIGNSSLKKRVLASAGSAIFAIATLVTSGHAANAPGAKWPDLNTPAPEIGGGENDAALVIGIEDYQHLQDIAGAGANATAWFNWLLKSRKVPMAKLRLMRDGQAEDDDLERALDEAATRVGTGGVLWFVFIGHGAPAGDQRDGVVVAANAKPDPASLNDRSVRVQEVERRLRAGNPHRTVMVIDACFSGKRSADGVLVKNLQPVVSLKAPPRETLMLSAAKADQFAGPLPGAPLPAFSYLVLGAFRGWAKDVDNDGFVSGSEAIGFARDALSMQSGRKQEPEASGPGADHPLLRRGTEPGPDLAALAVSGAEAPAEQAEGLAFGGGSVVKVQVPKFEVQRELRGGLRNVNIDAEHAFEDAQDAQDNPKSTAAEKRDGWCKLSNIEGNNPYKDQAGLACNNWQNYVTMLTKLDATIEQDAKLLGQFLALKRKPLSIKLSALMEFKKVYAPRLDHPEAVKVLAQAHSVLGAAAEFKSNPSPPPAAEKSAVPDDVVVAKAPEEPEVDAAKGVKVAAVAPVQDAGRAPSGVIADIGLASMVAHELQHAVRATVGWRWGNWGVQTSALVSLDDYSPSGLEFAVVRSRPSYRLSLGLAAITQVATMGFRSFNEFGEITGEGVIATNWAGPVCAFEWKIPISWFPQFLTFRTALGYSVVDSDRAMVTVGANLAWPKW